MEVEKQSMAIKGGKRPGAGRKRGVPNKINAEVRRRALESGASPLEVLLTLMRKAEPTRRPDESGLAYFTRWKSWADQRLDAAKAAAPYVHHRLAVVEQTGTGGGPIQHIVTVEVVE